MSESDPRAWPDSPTRLAAELARLAAQVGPHIGGRDDAPEAAATLPCTDPATGRTLTSVAVASPAHRERAVEAAVNAAADWAATSGRLRSAALLRLAEQLEDRRSELAVLETLDTGRPVRLTRDDDLPRSVDQLVHHAGWADKLDWLGRGPAPQALGVSALVLSSQRPMATLLGWLAPALAAGNTVVVAADPSTPLSAVRIAELALAAGVPTGVVNVVTAEVSTTAALLDDPAVAAVTVPDASAHPIAHLLFDDAPIDEAIDAVVTDACSQQGREHGGGVRLLVQESVHDEVVDRLRDRMGRLRVTDPLDLNADVGPVLDASEVTRLDELVTAAGRVGAHTWTWPGSTPSVGTWFPPMLLSELADGAEPTRASCPGPVLRVGSFRTPLEATRAVRGAPAAGVWTEKGSRALAVAAALELGTVWINGTAQLAASAGVDRSAARADLLDQLAAPTPWEVQR